MSGSQQDSSEEASKSALVVSSKSAPVVSTDFTKKSPKAVLHEICARERWNMPEYKCCYEEGPSHLKCFGFMITLQVEGPQATVLECYGQRKPTKKAATDSVAEAALWCLGNMGFC